METVYLETSIIGYVTFRMSRDLVTAAHQQITREWWDLQRQNRNLYISQAVITECSAGDPKAAKERLERLIGIPILDTTADAEKLADEVMSHLPLPEKASIDAPHVATATVNGIDYLRTWNCAHIANAVFKHRLEAVCLVAGFEPPVICTPEQLMGD
jgi:predicted nucleic acid-binding protein